MIDTLCSELCCRKVVLGGVGVGLPTPTALKVTRAHNPNESPLFCQVTERLSLWRDYTSYPF